MAWDLSGNIRGPAGEGQSAVETWEYGPFAEANPSYKAAAKAAGTSGLRTVVLSDSTSDAFSGGRTGAGNQTSTAWKDTWPGRLNRKIRDQLGLPAGGVGWIPPNTPTPPEGYAYRTTLLEPSNWNTIDDLTFNQGIPGSMWLQRSRVEGSAIYIDTVTYTLTPGTTSIEVYISGYGALIEIQTSNGARDYQTAGNGDEKRWITITNPGAQVRFRANSGQGFAMLGLMEYVGDEVAGSKMMNLAIAGVRGEEVYSWLQDPARAMKQSIARYNPQLAIVVLGSNDIGYGRTPGEVLNTLGGITMELKNAVPNINVLLVMRENPDVNYQQLVTLVKQNAASVGASVLDVGLDPRLDLSAAGIYITDNEHYSSAGDEMMAVVMAEHLKVKKTSGAIDETKVLELIEPVRKSAQAVSAPKWFHDFKSSVMGDPAPTISDSGLPMHWAVGYGTAPQFVSGSFTLFSVGATYCCTEDLGANANHVKARFVIAAAANGTAGGVVCVALTDRKLTTANWSAMNMSVHFLTTKTTWYITVWDSALGGQVVLRYGTYAVPLANDSVQQHEIAAWTSGTRGIYQLPDGSVQYIDDARIAKYPARFAFAEVLLNSTTDDIPCILAVAAGVDTMPAFLQRNPPAAPVAPVSQASNYKITAAVATPAGGAPTAIGPMEYVSGINYPLSGNYVRLPKGTYLISGSVEFNAASSASNGGWVGFNDGESTAPVAYFGESNTLAIAIKTSGAAIVEVTGASGLVSLVAISGSTNASQRAIKTGGQNKLSIVKV